MCVRKRRILVINSYPTPPPLFPKSCIRPCITSPLLQISTPPPPGAAATGSQGCHWAIIVKRWEGVDHVVGGDGGGGGGDCEITVICFIDQGPVHSRRQTEIIGKQDPDWHSIKICFTVKWFCGQGLCIWS